ncbi:MAG: hypothetical protein HQM08_17730 [Candidatus Riflebacteria bacterium]|nr:hypothetical protein [Candidatus Riflebacteria bacterium]
MRKLFFLIMLWFLLNPAFSSDNSTLISLELRDADLKETLIMLAEKAKINLIISPKIKGTITCRFKQIDPLELIQLIAKTNGLYLEEHGNIKAILPENSDSGELKINFISLQNSDSENVSKTLEKLKSDKNTSIIPDKQNNRLIIIQH